MFLDLNLDWYDNACLHIWLMYKVLMKHALVKIKKKILQEATQILQSLSNDTHQVITAVGFLQKNKWECIHEISEVTFGFLSDEAIQSYIKSGSPMDKAGAYGIQDSFGVQNILSISGSYTNIIGLPVAQVLEKLKEIIKEV